jgi:8-oxo-dGTP pyrophosphatase MutT (NUDIX family)
VDEEKAHRLFGTPVSGPAYIGCFGAYGVARSAHGLVAAVVDDDGRLYFPGGGVLPGESAASALEREAREECARIVAVGELLGRAFQLVDTQREGSSLLDAPTSGYPSGWRTTHPPNTGSCGFPAKTCAERMHRACDRWLADHRLTGGF